MHMIRAWDGYDTTIVTLTTLHVDSHLLPAQLRPYVPMSNEQCLLVPGQCIQPMH